MRTEKEKEEIKEQPKKTEKEEIKEKTKKSEKKIKSKEKPAINSQEYVDKMIARKHTIIKIAIILVIIIIILLIGSTCFAIYAMTNSEIISGITIDSIDVSGLNKEEACKLLEEKLKEKQETSIKLTYEDYEQEIKLEELSLTAEIEEKVDEALRKGREDNIFVNNFEVIKSKFTTQNIDIEVSYDEEVLDRFFIDVNTSIPGLVEEYTYEIVEDELIITPGKDGIVLDTETLKNQISEEITDLSKDVTTQRTIPVIEQEAAEIDIEAIYNEIYSEPQDAYIVEDPFQVVVDQDGVDFAITMEEAKAILAEEAEEYIIPLKITEASTTVADLGSKAFPDQLSYYTTRYDSGNTNRTTNLKLAANKINGYVVQPGETFSYNQVVGKRTVENGYKEAAVYTSSGVENGLGGGICQISSTLYDATVLANLEIVERHNHSYITSYADPSLDATVVYGSLDFQFKNNRTYPIKIVATVSGGVATVSIYGIKEDTDYTVKIKSVTLSTIACNVETIEDDTLPEGTETVVTKGTNGCKSTAYKYLYDSAGNLVSTVQLSTDTYGTIKRVVKVGTKKVAETSTSPSTSATTSTSPSPSVSTSPSTDTSDTEEEESEVEGE